MVVVDRVGNCKRDGRRRERGESVIEYRAKTSPEIPVGATSSFDPSTICILCIWIAFITRRTHTSLGANCRPEKSWTRACMLQTATHLAASLLMPCLESIRTRASTYTSHSCSCDTVHASVLSTTNAIGNDEFVEQRKRHFPRECTLLPSSSSRAFLAFFSASPLIAPLFFSTPPFVFYSLLPSLAFQPLRNVSLLNVPQNHSRIFPFFSSTTCFVSRNSCIPLCSTWFY